MIDSDDVDDFLVTFMQPPKTARGWAGLEGKRICRRFMGGITNSIGKLWLIREIISKWPNCSGK